MDSKTNGSIGNIVGWTIPTTGPMSIHLEHGGTISFTVRDDLINIKEMLALYPDVLIVDFPESDSIPFDQDGFCNLLKVGV